MLYQPTCFLAVVAAEHAGLGGMKHEPHFGSWLKNFPCHRK